MLTKFCHALKHFSMSFIVKMYIHQKSNTGNNLGRKFFVENQLKQCYISTQKYK